jgi:hypothetical protein
MNCQEFELIVHEMAREQPLDAAVRREGLAHVSACADCAGLLAGAYSLGAGLRALAAESPLKEAPASVETALLEAFKQLTRPAGVRRDPPRWESARWVMAKWVLAATAAAVLAAVTLGVRYWRAQRTIPEVQPARVSAPAAATDRGAGDGNPAAHLAAASRGNGAGSIERRGGIASQATPAAKLATDFLPLDGILDPLDFEQAELVRVSLPGSALADLGLPFNEEAETTTITAEVLIAEDGTARAIRIPR